MELNADLSFGEPTRYYLTTHEYAELMSGLDIKQRSYGYWLKFARAEYARQTSGIK